MLIGASHRENYVVQAVHPDHESITVCWVSNQLSEEVTVGVVAGLGRLAQLGDQKLAVPVLFQQLAFEVQRDLRILLRAVLVRVACTIEEAHRKVGAVKPHADPADFRMQSRDLYVPAGDVGFWQGALRDPADPFFRDVARGIADRTPITVDVLYGDHEGGQRTITRFALWPAGEDSWLTTTTRHWNLDGSGFRDDG